MRPEGAEDAVRLTIPGVGDQKAERRTLRTRQGGVNQMGRERRGTMTHVPQYVADVLALLDALALGAVHVVGTSLGGLVGLPWRGSRRIDSAPSC